MRKYLYLAMAATFALFSCGGGEEHEIITSGKTYTQEVNLSCEATTQSVSLTRSWKTTDIAGVSNQASWLTVNTTNAPQITLTATENKNSANRSSVVTINAHNGDKILLNVTQSGVTEQPEEPKDGIDDTHDTVTDQPAYAPRR